MAAVAGFASCREPTQITVRVTTDAGCPTDGLRPRINDVSIVTGRKLQTGTPGNPQPMPVANAVTEQCAAEGGVNTVGTLVLLPDGGDDPTVDVMIVAGVQRDETDDGAHSMGADACAALAFSGESIEGLPCIIARRRLTFIDHESLVLPIDLDKSCIGEDCGSDLTCFKGNCVSPDVACAEGDDDCNPPAGCAEECENVCPSGNGTCIDGACSCLPCDPVECAGTDECAGGSSGVCSADGTECSCVAACDPVACSEAGGTCDGAQCILPCTGTEMCECDADQCPTACEEGSCGCLGPCTVSSCGNCENGTAPICDDLTCGCSCQCTAEACAAHCASLGQGNPHCEAGTCVCEPTTGEGGGGMTNIGGASNVGGANVGGITNIGGANLGGAPGVGGGPNPGVGGGPSSLCPSIVMAPCDPAMCSAACGATPNCTGTCVAAFAPPQAPIPGTECVCVETP
ncbi:MAG: hypothetical protein HOW73_01215 [Polyangiaceae bacterium]|nr:hypothetical protein [Polyangiaceae bacterium]